MTRNRIFSLVLVILSVVLVVSNFGLIYKVSASDKNRSEARAEYRQFREILVAKLAANEIKHNELTMQLKVLKSEFTRDAEKLRRLERSLPYEAMADRAR